MFDPSETPWDSMLAAFSPDPFQYENIDPTSGNSSVVLTPSSTPYSSEEELFQYGGTDLNSSSSSVFPTSSSTPYPPDVGSSSSYIQTVHGYTEQQQVHARNRHGQDMDEGFFFQYESSSLQRTPNDLCWNTFPLEQPYLNILQSPAQMIMSNRATQQQSSVSNYRDSGGLSQSVLHELLAEEMQPQQTTRSPSLSSTSIAPFDPLSQLRMMSPSPGLNITDPSTRRTLAQHRDSPRMSKNASSKGKSLRPLRPREKSALKEQTSDDSPSMSSSLSSDSQKHGFGGRSQPLTPQQKARAKAMRATVACWICALQRVTCSPDQVCLRCSERLSNRGPGHPLNCDRTMLADMINDFIPPRVAQVHGLAVMKNYVDGRILRWVQTESSVGIMVNLSIGYGPTLAWPMHEFQPLSRDAVVQLQWTLMDGGQRLSCERLSPPLAIRRLTEAHASHFGSFVDELVERHLERFQEVYRGDHADDPFRSGLVTLLCRLFQALPANTDDDTLRDDLKTALSAIVTTDIMLHHVTIEEASRDDIISQLTMFNDPLSYRDGFTSPKLANRQLKSYFQILQKQFLENALERFHKILRMTKGRQRGLTWLSSLVIMLAMAVCQEEMQHSRCLRADGESLRLERTKEDAVRDARQDCQRGDAAFDFLIKLFNCKYSPAKRYVARMADWRNTFSCQVEDEFLGGLQELGKRHRVMLLCRRDSEVNLAMDATYKSRLAARFLVGFMELGGG